PTSAEPSQSRGLGWLASPYCGRKTDRLAMYGLISTARCGPTLSTPSRMPKYDTKPLAARGTTDDESTSWVRAMLRRAMNPQAGWEPSTPRRWSGIASSAVQPSGPTDAFPSQTPSQLGSQIVSS